MESRPAWDTAARLADRFIGLSGVRAVALGGSRTGPFGDATSDIDLYVYTDEPPPVQQRAALIGRARGVELDNQFWETGDEWEDAESGLVVDVMYRSPAFVESELDRLLVRYQASMGYTTAVWHNIRTSVVLVDQTGWLMALKQRADQPYPEQLRRAIVAKNYPVLGMVKGSYRNQIAKALERDDPVSVNHRLAALLASVFDILFAVNRQTHPGEKRSLAWTAAICPVRPPRCDDQVRAVLKRAAGEGLLPAVDALLDGLDGVLREERLIDVDELALKDLSTGRV